MKHHNRTVSSNKKKGENKNSVVSSKKNKKEKTRIQLMKSNFIPGIFQRGKNFKDNKIQ